MADTTTSTAMSMPIPVVGVDPGPQWAIDVDNCLLIIDGHNHSPGQGNLITPAGLSINADLTFGNNNATFLRSVRFQSQGSPLSGIADLGCLYESGVDLYYNDGSGNQIRLTQSGSIVGTSGSISGLVPPASASYNSGTATFIFQSAANTPANVDGASFLFRNLVASSKALTLNPPAAMGANFSLTLPNIPASQMFMTLDNAGNMSAPWAVDNSTLEIASGTTLQVKDGGITDAKIQAGGLTTPSIANAAITPIKRSATSVAFGTSSGGYTNGTNSYTDISSVSYTSDNNKSVVLELMALFGSSETNPASITTAFGSVNNTAFIELFRGSSLLAGWAYPTANTYASSSLTSPVMSVPKFIDNPSSGTYTYTFRARMSTADGSIKVFNMQAVAYELG